MEKFLNPYNFISLPPKKAPVYDTEENVHLTGKIRYKMTTRSPLFIPNSSTDEAFEVSQKVKGHKSYDFYSYQELLPYAKTGCNPKPQCPVIPGSEIRGVIRSVYETLTDSCMGVLNSETMPVKRSPQEFTPGILKRSSRGYMLMEAKSYRIGAAAEKDKFPVGFENHRNGTQIFFQDSKGAWRKSITRYQILQDTQKRSTGFTDSGYLMKWGMGVRKKRYHIFVPITAQNVKGVPKILSREDIETRLLGVIESYLEQPLMKKESQRENKEAYEAYQKELISFLKGEYGMNSCFPVTFSVLENGSKWYLAPAIYTKEISNNQIGELAGEFAPCHGTEECPACDLFGHVDKEGKGSKGSKLRFSDLRVVDQKSPEEYYYPVTTLPALGEPKLGNVDFYLKKPENASFWTYDYYYQYTENGDGATLIEEPGELRGRKYYWHHPQYCVKKSSDLPKDDLGSLNKTVRPLKNEISFVGEVYFEDISEKQLKQLIWILNAEKENIGYKLGTAKPFGFGSITCQVLGATGRNISVENGRIIYKENENLAEEYLNLSYEDVFFSTHCKEQFYRIAKLDSVKPDMKIMYPKTWRQVKNGDTGEGFRWFTANHTNIKGNGMPKDRAQRKICVTLPSLEEKDVGLPYEIPGVRNQNQYGNGRSQNQHRNGKNQNQHGIGRNKTMRGK